MAGMDQHTLLACSSIAGCTKHPSLLYICIYCKQQFVGPNRYTVERKKFDSPKRRTNYNIYSRFTSIESFTLRTG